MSLTKSFRDLVRHRASKDPAFATACLREKRRFTAEMAESFDDLRKLGMIDDAAYEAALGDRGECKSFLPLPGCRGFTISTTDLNSNARRREGK